MSTPEIFALHDALNGATARAIAAETALFAQTTRTNEAQAELAKAEARLAAVARMARNLHANGNRVLAEDLLCTNRGADMSPDELRAECFEESCDDGDCWVRDAANEIARLRDERDLWESAALQFDAEADHWLHQRNRYQAAWASAYGRALHWRVAATTWIATGARL